MTDTKRSPADYIVPLSINGMEGRMLHVPMQVDGKKREVLFVYGHHSTLERWGGLVDVLSAYGTVTMPDLPGLGGMDSFYKIGKNASIDSYADYLAAFVKLRYRRKKFVLAGMSFGFIVVTRMLQRYPEMTAKVELLISIAGFTHHDDFLFTPKRMLAYQVGTTILSAAPIAWLFRHTALTAPVLRAAYARTFSAKHKFSQAEGKAEFDAMMNTEIDLWHKNDPRSHWVTARQLLRIDNCRQYVDLPVWHVSSANDHFFNNNVVEQHMRTVFSDFHDEPVNMPSHAPSVVADAEMAAPLIPKNLRKVLLDLP